MKIQTGLFKGLRLRAPESGKTRPTKSSLREAVFNILGQELYHQSFLDLCAGSGIMGIEAISRGACHATLLEKERRAFRTVLQNAEMAKKRAHGFEISLQVQHTDYRSYLKKTRNLYDIMYFDPPYEHYFEAGWQNTDFAVSLSEKGVLILEHSAHAPRSLPQSLSGLGLWETRSYGQSRLSFYRHESKA